jgi:hypothetical protein
MPRGIPLCYTTLLQTELTELPLRPWYNREGKDVKKIHFAGALTDLPIHNILRFVDPFLVAAIPTSMIE